MLISIKKSKAMHVLRPMRVDGTTTAVIATVETFCGGKTDSRCSNVRLSIQDIVDVSGNERATVNIAHIKTDAEFLSRYNKYHKHCHTGNCLTARELARLGIKESERLVATTSTTSSPQHHQLSQSIIVRQERFIAQLKSVLAPCNSFQMEVASERSDRKYRIFKLMSNEIIPDEVQQSILATEETGM